MTETEIIKYIADKYDIKPKLFFNKTTRKIEFVKARIVFWAVMLILFNKRPYRLEKIYHFDHATIYNHVNNFKESIRLNDKECSKEIEAYKEIQNIIQINKVSKAEINDKFNNLISNHHISVAAQSKIKQMLKECYLLGKNNKELNLQ